MDRFSGDFGYCLHLLIAGCTDLDHGGWLPATVGVGPQMIVKGSPVADASLAHREKALIATCKMNAVNPYAYDIQSLQVLRNMIKGHRDYWCYLVALLPKKINSDDKLPNGDECDKVAQSMHPAYSFAGKQSEIGQIFRAGSVANAAPLLPGVFLDLTVP